jgi:hypothetical protein
VDHDLTARWHSSAASGFDVFCVRIRDANRSIERAVDLLVVQYVSTLGRSPVALLPFVADWVSAKDNRKLIYDLSLADELERSIGLMHTHKIDSIFGHSELSEQKKN